jgi:hypothetical protein
MYTTIGVNSLNFDLRVRYKTNSTNSSSRFDNKKLEVIIFEMFKSNIVTIQLS